MQMFKFILSSISILWSLSGNAQIFNLSKELFSNEPFFNADFISENHIKSIKGEFHFKRDKEKMISKNSSICYEFDTLGRLIRQYATVPKAETLPDTVFIYFEYDSINRVSIKRTADNFGFYSYSFVYDNRGNVIKEIYNREISSGTYLGDFNLARQFPMGTEEFVFEYFGPFHFKKKILNNLGVAYKEILYQVNEKKMIVEENGIFLTTGQREKKVFTYNDKFQLVEKAEFSDIAGGNSIRYSYQYDETGNLLEIKKHKNEELIQFTEFMLNDKGAITAKLTRHIAEKLIDIIKFSIDYYP
jgi:hypothetical protein